MFLRVLACYLAWKLQLKLRFRTPLPEERTISKLHWREVRVHHGNLVVLEPPWPLHEKAHTLVPGQ